MTWSVKIERRVEWADTDAAGHYHFSTVLRLAEAAEAELLRTLGLGHLFGVIPRVHFEADYLQRLWFGEQVETELEIAAVGVSSLHYTFTVRGTQGVAATGRMSVVHMDAEAGGSVPWPDDIRRTLARPQI